MDVQLLLISITQTFLLFSMGYFVEFFNVFDKFLVHQVRYTGFDIQHLWPVKQRTVDPNFIKKSAYYYHMCRDVFSGQNFSLRIVEIDQ